MKHISTAGIVAFSWVLLAGCAGAATVQKEPGVDLSRYRTYAWIEERDSTVPGHNTLQSQNIHRAVDEQLAASNWREDRNNPDVILTHDVLVEKTVQQRNDPVYSRPFTRAYYNPYTRHFGTIYYPSRFYGYYNSQYQVNEATISLSIIDARTDRMVAQAWTTEEVGSSNITGSEIERGVNAIFRKLKKELQRQ